MSQFKADRPETFISNGALANPWRFVVITADRTVGLAGAAARADGVLMSTADAAGQEVAVATEGSGNSIRIEAGAAFAAGAKLAPDATGRAVTAGAAAQYSAVATQAATAAGDLVECHLRSGTAA